MAAAAGWLGEGIEGLAAREPGAERSAGRRQPVNELIGLKAFSRLSRMVRHLVWGGGTHIAWATQQQLSRLINRKIRSLLLTPPASSWTGREYPGRLQVYAGQPC